MKEILNYNFLGNASIDYIVVFFLIFIGITTITILKKFIVNSIQKKITIKIDSNEKFNSLETGLFYILYYSVIYLSFQQLNLNNTVNKFLKVAGLLLIITFVVRLIITIIDTLMIHYCFKKQDPQSKERNIKALNPIIKILVWSLAVFFFLDNLGFKVSTLIAGLGIGGVAVALAGQAVLGDLFSYFAILFDKPFEINDFIMTGDTMGVIEHIGIKTTRVRSLGGEEIVFSNTDLINSRVRNFKRMQQRRASFKLGVTYQTSSEKLKKIPEIIKNIVDSIEHAKFDRSHFSAFGDFNLNIETVYYVISKDYDVYMNIQQEINLRIKEEFEKHEIEFAYPTSTVFLQNQ